VFERFLLDEILAPGNLSVCFQPVLEVQPGRTRAHYYEALIRGPRGTSAENPSILFEYARRKSKESAVDRACVAAILDAACGLPSGAVLGVNVHASTLAMDAGFVAYLLEATRAHGFSPDRLVVEVVEHAPPWDVIGFRTSLGTLREAGVRIALDDVGLGHSNFMMILECRPDYFKVDRHFVHGCHKDFHRRAVLASVAQLARPFGARVVAEGVEEPADMLTLRRVGITLVQGYLFGMPAPAAETLARIASAGPLSLRADRRRGSFGRGWFGAAAGVRSGSRH
jgi:EAL domain-containing protein (putative c-di-GMP-specific phosphodiesterase class I)